MLFRLNDRYENDFEWLLNAVDFSFDYVFLKNEHQPRQACKTCQDHFFLFFVIGIHLMLFCKSSAPPGFVARENEACLRDLFDKIL